MLIGLTVVAVAVALQGGGACAEPRFPALTGRVVDQANLLEPEDEQTLTRELEALERKTADQLVIVTLPSLQGYDIADFGYRLGRKWGIGRAGKDNGVLLIVAPNERRVRIEVGRRLEPTLTDAASKLIIENAITPAFKRGDFAGGIKAGVRDIIGLVTDDRQVVEELRRAASESGQPMPPWLVIAVWLVILLVVIWIMWSSGGGRSGPIIFMPGGSGGGWNSGGGGFSGGGGDFGGGGASGSW